MSTTPTDRHWVGIAAAYVLVLALLNLPSALLWAAPEWRLVDHEYDFFLGQGWAVEWFGANALVVGRVLHSALFLLAGGLFARLCWPWLAGKAVPGRTAVTVTVILAVMVSLAGLPWMSPDVFYYLAKGWLYVGYGLNPYVAEINQAPGYLHDPLFQNVHPDFLHHNIDYGPVFQFLAVLSVWLGGGDPKLSLLVFKLIMVLSVLGMGIAARMIVRQVRAESDMAQLALFATMANPVTLFALVTCAHNDGLVAVTIAVAIWKVLEGRWHTAGGALALGFCIKYIPVLILPILVLYAQSQRQLAYGQALGKWRVAVSFLVSFLISVVVLHLAFPHSWSNLFDLVGGGFHLFRNNHFFLAAAASTEWATQWQSPWLTLFRGVFVLSYLLLLWKWWLQRAKTTPIDIVQRSLLVLIGYLLVGSIAIHEWYLCWWLPLAFLLADRALWRATLVLLAVFPALVIWTKNADATLNVGVNLLLYVICVGLALWYWRQSSGHPEARNS